MPGVAARHVYSILIGLLMLFVCFDTSGVVRFFPPVPLCQTLISQLHFFAAPTIVYALMQFLPSRYFPTVAMVVMMGYLSGLHIHRMITAWLAYNLDVTCPLSFLPIAIASSGYFPPPSP